MHNFIEKLARQLKEAHGENFADICVVMPNRRAGLFLRQAIAKQIEKPVLSPDIYSIGDFFTEVSGLMPTDDIGLLFEFYEIHRAIEGKNQQPFEEFMRWARILLNDFEEIDAHLVDAGMLFRYLNEVKAIEKWHLGEGPLTETEKSYLKFYNSLFDYYERLKERLLKSGAAYQGLINRHVAEQAESILQDLRWEKIYFTGFNALTTAEKKLIGYLKAAGRTEMLWDSDAYYMDDTRQEAGFYLRREAQKSGEKFRWKESSFKEIAKQIEILGVPGKVCQARLAAGIVNQWIGLPLPPDTGLQHSAVVLADESLLIPLLSAMPDDLSDFNLTMGYPLKFTSAYQFLQTIFRLYENNERFAQMRERQLPGFYHADLIKIQQHPFIRRFAGDSMLSQKIRKANRVVYTADEIGEMLRETNDPTKPVFDLLFEKALPSPEEIIQKTGEVIGLLRDLYLEEQKNESRKNFDIEYLYHFARINNRLAGLLSKYRSVDNAKTLRQLFTSIAATTRIPFSGEPLKGLQVMGMLETRNLDFDRLILISANEGILPAALPGNSFIPWDIQREFGLPTYQEKNAVFAYHFYRLLQRAREVHLIYNTEPGTLGGGEPSRFIRQMIQELTVYQPNTVISQRIVSTPPPPKSDELSLTIEKDDEVMSALQIKAEKGFSPTTLNRFRNCSLQFYLQEIAGIDEAEEVEESLEARTMGNIVHYALEQMYAPFVDRNLSPEDVSGLLRNMDEFLKIAYLRKYPEGDISLGRNRLLSEVIRQFVTRFLETEKTQLEYIQKNGNELFIRGLEKYIKTTIEISSPEISTVNVKGTIDRIDETGGIFRIVDYKTGMVKEKDELWFDNWEKFLEKSGTDKAFQVLTYAWLYRQHTGLSGQQFESGVISMRLLSQWFARFGIKTGKSTADTLIDSEKLDKYEDLLRETLEMIFDRSIPFAQTDDPDTCRYCNFKNLCRR